MDFSKFKERMANQTPEEIAMKKYREEEHAKWYANRKPRPKEEINPEELEREPEEPEYEEDYQPSTETKLMWLTKLEFEDWIAEYWNTLDKSAQAIAGSLDSTNFRRQAKKLYKTLDAQRREAIFSTSDRLEGFKDKRLSKEDVIGKSNKKAMEIISEAIRDYNKNKAVYDSIGITSIGNIVLYGFPGCGKDMLVQATCDTAEDEGYKFVVKVIKFKDVASGKVGSASKRIEEIYSQLEKLSGLKIVIINECDAIIPLDNSRRFHGALAEERVNALLPHLQKHPDIMHICMTNVIDQVNWRFLRSYRFDEVLEIELPDEEDRAKLMNKLIANIAMEESLDIPYLVSKTQGYAGSDFQAISDKLKKQWVRKGCKKLTKQEVNQTIAEHQSLIAIRARIGCSIERQKKSLNITS